MSLENKSQVGEMAKEIFAKGPNCAESVVMALLASNKAGLTKEDIRFASGFGGGIGKHGLTCGALTGAVIAVSSVYGRKDPTALNDYALIKAELSSENGLYTILNKLTTEFKKEVGSTVCKEIIDIPGENAAKLKFEKCQNAVGIAASLAYEYININK